MTDRPMIFSGPMVKALLAGRKTQTRMILQPQPYPLEGRPGFWNASGRVGGRICISDKHLLDLHGFRVGSLLWVREAHSVRITPDDATDGIGRVWFRADSEWADDDRMAWRPSIHMPRWTSRLTLTVTGVRMQRLQEISEEDALAEGVQKAPGGWWSGAEGQAGTTPQAAYGVLWNSLHGPDTWNRNPWVCALTFSVEHRNIDAVREAA